MEILFFSAFVLGLIFNAAPGAVFAETVKEGLRGGFRSALAVQLGSLVGDAVWAILGLVGIGLLLQLEWLKVPVGVAGAGYLIWLAIDSWSAASKEFTVGEKPTSSHSGKAFRAGVVLSLTNPQNVAYWAAIGSAMGAVGVADPLLQDYAVFFLGFMAASVVWSFLCAAIVDRVFRNFGPKWTRLTYRVCAIAFLVLALNSIRNIVSPYHPGEAERQPEVQVQKP